MMTRNQCISLLRSCADVLRQRFGIRSLCLFGSMARNEQREESDVDVCVEMPPKLFLLVELGMNEFLRKEIEKDGIYVIQA